jgi:hypothetical protein
VWLGFQLYLQPATGPSWFLVQSYDYSNVERYRHFLTLLLFQGRPIELSRGNIPANSLYVLFPALIIFGIIMSARARKNADFRGVRMVYSYITLTVVWVALITNLLEFGENNRIRFETDPLIVILAAAAAQDIINRIRRRPSSAVNSGMSAGSSLIQ